jgi:hypothetical protein
MKIIYDHSKGHIDDDRVFCEVFCLPETETNDDLLELGWLPYTSLQIPYWYQSQSVRINPNKISLSYKRRKIISELKYEILDYQSHKKEVDEFFYQYFDKKSFDLKKSYDTNSINVNIEIMRISHMDNTVGMVRFQTFERNVLGFETAYDLNLTKFSLGKTAIILLAQETNLRGKKHVYIYESYQNHFSYKLEISGVEYWEGEYWK